MLAYRKVETMKVVRGTFVFLFALVISAGSALAQDAPAVGAMAGVNLSYFSVSPSGDTSIKPGFVLGGFAVFRRDKMFKIQPEVQVSQRRVEVTYAGTDTTYSATYLNLGLMFRTKLYKGLYTTQGPQFSVPLRASLKVPGGTADTKDNIAKDFSLVVGLGQQFGRVGIEGRWDSGFKRVEKVALGGFVKRNRAITLMTTVGF